MAIIDSQAELKISYFDDARVIRYGEIVSLGATSQGSIFPVASVAAEMICSYSNHVYVRFLGLESIASQMNYCILAYPCAVFPKGITFQDYLSSHARFFGIGFNQDTRYIYIKKADLPFLESTTNNTAQSLLVALLMRVMLYESNNLISLVNVYKWSTSFLKSQTEASILNTLIVEINVPVKYKYVNVEIVNANNSLKPDEL